MKQQTLAIAADQSGYEQHRKPTRRDEFLATMEAIVPWSALRLLQSLKSSPHTRPSVSRDRQVFLVGDWA